jgi:hypothetical protein
MHPERRDEIQECSYELAWRAAVAGDAPAVEEAAALTLGADERRDDPSIIPRARGFRMIARRQFAAAVEHFRSFAPIDADAPWWRQLSAVDVALGLALAERGLGHTARAAAHLDTAERAARAIIAGAPIVAHHRLSAIAALRAPG